MTMVYVVSRGEYSDYAIVALFSTKEKATKYIKYVNSQLDTYSKLNSFIEKFELNIPLETSIITWVRMDKKGKTIETWKSLNADSNYNPIFDNDQNLVYPVNTINITRAIKVTNEKRTKLLTLSTMTELAEWGNNRLLSFLKKVK